MLVPVPSTPCWRAPRLVRCSGERGNAIKQTVEKNSGSVAAHTRILNGRHFRSRQRVGASHSGLQLALWLGETKCGKARGGGGSSSSSSRLLSTDVILFFSSSSSCLCIRNARTAHSTRTDPTHANTIFPSASKKFGDSRPHRTREREEVSGQLHRACQISGCLPSSPRSKSPQGIRTTMRAFLSRAALVLALLQASFLLRCVRPFAWPMCMTHHQPAWILCNSVGLIRVRPHAVRLFCRLLPPLRP
jgi:hypothetical protein